MHIIEHYAWESRNKELLAQAEAFIEDLHNGAPDNGAEWTEVSNIDRRILANSHAYYVMDTQNPCIGIATVDFFSEIEVFLPLAERLPNTVLIQHGYNNITFRGTPIFQDLEIPVVDGVQYFFWIEFDPETGPIYKSVIKSYPREQAK